MSIKLAILGLLSWKPSTGYDLKKMIEDSSFMHWSGNNNQIYKSLVQLLEDGWVTHEVQHQESSPSKKIYTITDKGLAELRNWVDSSPELPELKKGFLTQLAWADQLNSKELDDLLSRYEAEISLHLALQEEKKRRSLYVPNRTEREACLWEMIAENIISSYRNELLWVQQLRQKLV
ncbi:PadR family transcriptional regulator [Paenibacillus pinihumi]|uniref:PadR family transcriptional regulator n=1 Tax=Paenibacillus pinihumi TaxID=669462 RepID=UPI00040803E2|nr:PadR family transcriptional regulator [Paenibacillus pinihumi]